MRLEILADETPTSLIRPEFSIYRRTTVAFLRKYFRMSIELGHLPSLLGREFFRTHVTSYTTSTFEDAVIFTHDAERCLHSLPPRLQWVLARVVFMEYTQAEVAEMMGVSWRTLARWYAEALDRMAEVCVRHGLLEPIPIAEEPWTSGVSKQVNQKTAQEGLADFSGKKPVRSVQANNAKSLCFSKLQCG